MLNKELTKADEFINEGLKQIDEEVKSEDEIKSQAIYITELLEKEPVVRVEYNGDMYTLSQKTGKEPSKIVDKDGKTKVIKTDVIILAAINERKRRQAYIQNKPYISPAIYKGEYNDEFTLRENLIAVVEAFLRHVIGEIKIEETDDGIAKIAREKDMM